MRRPLIARKALRRSPLMKARRAHSSGIKRVPFMAASARPAVVFAGRPTAKRASNAAARVVGAFLLSGLAIQDNKGVIREGAHTRLNSIIMIKCLKGSSG